MEILLYGLGKLTEKIENIIKPEHRVVGYTDSFAKLQIYHNKPFYPLEKIKEARFDCIIITIENRKVAWEIRQLLIDDYGIKKEKIIPFSIYAKSEIVEYMIESKKDVRGIILGNSLAYHGYLPDYLDEPFVNLACPSQGIYHSYLALQKYCRNMTGNLKYLVYDLWDYNIFNLDLSLSKSLFEYIYVGGVKDKGNYDFNSHYTGSFEEELFEKYYMVTALHEDEEILMNLVFGNYINPIMDEMVNCSANNNWAIVRKDAPLPVEYFMADTTLKKFDKTMIENIEIMENLIKFVKEKSPDCKIIFTLIPRYISMDKVFSVFMKRWQEDFESIVRRLQRVYGVYFISYKDRTDISENAQFYYDTEHLNTRGGGAMTSILNDDLKKIGDSISNERWFL